MYFELVVRLGVKMNVGTIARFGVFFFLLEIFLNQVASNCHYIDMVHVDAVKTFTVSDKRTTRRTDCRIEKGQERVTC